MIGKNARESDRSGEPDRKTKLPAPVPEERRLAAWIGPSVVIHGDLTSSEDMTIAGRVEGDVAVRNHALVIASGATIQGSVVARAVAVHGEVVGTITADGRVEVGETGSVRGDIDAPRLVVAEGAVLDGRLGVSAARATPGR